MTGARRAVSGDADSDGLLTFTCTANRGDKGWLVRCDQHSAMCCRVRLLAQAADEMRMILTAQLGLVPEAVAVEIIPTLPTHVRHHMDRAEQLRHTAVWANNAAAIETRAAARGLAQAGLSLRDIGTIFGVSFQRAHQLVSDEVR